MKKKSLFISILLFCTSCKFPIYAYDDPKVNIIDVYPAVYNLKDLNTKYDEYNSAPPPGYYSKRSLITDTMFIYSTNSGNEGKNFDIWKGKITFEQKSRLRGEKNPDPIINSKRLSPFLKNETSSDSNEFGPYLFFNPKPQNIIVTPPKKQNSTNYSYSPTSNLKFESENTILYSDFLSKKDDKELLGANLYFYASDKKGDLDIYYYSDKSGVREFFGNKENSNERYLSYDYKRNVLYFASDRDGGKYDIYKYENKTGNFNFEDFFNNKELSKDIVKASELNSVNNDTCPVVIDDYMIFSTDRVGTKGGYDIYISKFDEQKQSWEKPQNIQNLIDIYYSSTGSEITKDELKNLDLEINTKYDEFRPFIIENIYNSEYSELRHTDNIYEDNPSRTYTIPKSMIFSSNRPGGKGGFDLYLGILPDLYFPRI